MGVDDSADNIGIEGENKDDSGMNEEPSNIHAAVLARIAEIEFETNLIQAIRQASQDVDVAEVYSPPRVTTVASKLGLKAGEAMDLTNGWDFRLQRHRHAALRYIREAKPKLVIGSPECRPCSPLRNLTKHPKKTEEPKEQKVEAIEHIKFVVKLYEEQAKNGRLLLREYPAQVSPFPKQLSLTYRI